MDKMSPELAKITSMMVINSAYAIVCIIIALIFVWIGYVITIKIVKKNVSNDSRDALISSPIFHGSVILGMCIISGIVVGLACN